MKKRSGKKKSSKLIKSSKKVIIKSIRRNNKKKNDGSKTCETCTYAENDDDATICEICLGNNLVKNKKCPECGSINILTNRFCTNCDISLVKKCPECGTINMSDNHFCTDCKLDFNATKKCPMCTLNNKNFAEICIFCGYDFVNICASCNYSNEMGSSICSKCGADIPMRIEYREENIGYSMENGDCFFSSLFRCLIYTDNYNKFVRCFNEFYGTEFDEITIEVINKVKSEQKNRLDVKWFPHEEDFMVKSRKLLCDLNYIENRILNILENEDSFENFIINEALDHSDHMKIIAEKIIKGYQTKMQKGSVKDLYEFLKKYKKKYKEDSLALLHLWLPLVKEKLNTAGSYVGEYEFYMFKTLLENCDLNLLSISINPDARKNLIKRSDVEKTICLINIDSRHYVYYKFN